MVCADICNTSLTFGLKKKSLVKYINLLEVFGIDPRKAVKRMDEVSLLAEEAEETGTDYSIVPHSVYSVSLPLFRKIKERTILNKVTSIHFQESADEPEFLASHAGDLKESYEAGGLLPPVIDIAGSHSDAILNEVTQSGNLILVHNTYTDVDTIRQVNKRRNTFWCLCPSSNMYIEKKLPPADLLMSEGCVPVIGTDSLASNKKLSILSELKLLQNGFPSISLEELIKWGTINGARALGVDNNYGTIGPGMRPGLLLLENVDLQNLRLLPETTVTRLV
jgi:cytosine/adenosine deaminase-related metal-dependent hydrolase